MVLADSGRITRVPPYLGYPLGCSNVLRTRLSRSLAGLPSPFRYAPAVLPWPRNPEATRVTSVWASFSGFARHYYRNRVFFLFLQVLRCFTSLGLRYCPYGFGAEQRGVTRAGFPHSDIPGSTLGWQLPEAFRSHPRPSSPPTA